MRIGYPCLNRTIGCSPNRTFRLASYSEERLYETVKSNLNCLYRILEFNVRQGFYFFRLSSDLVPFASHPVNKFDWASTFAEEFREIGDFIKKNGMRISMHPDQFVLLNALDNKIVGSSIDELAYHAMVLDQMGLGQTARIQIHVGGVYGDKPAAMDRFVARYQTLDPSIKTHLVIENDDRLYSLADCLKVHHRTGIPVLFDDFHHALLNEGESRLEALTAASATWQKKDGLLMVDYSTQDKSGRPGKHCESIDIRHFKSFLKATRGFDFDLMLEIKNKEVSAAAAVAAAGGDLRLHAPAPAFFRSLLAK